MRPHRAPHAPILYRPRPDQPLLVAPAAARIVTLLTPLERIRLDAAAASVFVATHHESLLDVADALRAAPCVATVVSVDVLARGGRPDVARVAELVRLFPRVSTVALVGELGPNTPGVILALGRAGVRLLVDTRTPDGWTALRDLLGADPIRELGQRAVQQIHADLAGAPDSCLRFFTALFEVPPEAVTVQILAQRLGVQPTTLTSRFFRAGLPAPKRYLAFARLLRAARLLENGGTPLCTVADRLEYSSAQSFGRHIRLLLGVTAAEFRRSYDADRMLARFREDLVLPHRETLRRFHPFGL